MRGVMTARILEKYKLLFAVGHSADTDRVAALTIAYTKQARHYRESMGYLLNPKGRVLIAVYSSGPVGRLVAKNVIGMATYPKSKCR